MKSEQEIIVKEFDQLLRYSSDIDSVVEEEVENASLPLLATKTIVDLTLNQSLHWVCMSIIDLPEKPLIFHCILAKRIIRSRGN